MINIGIKCSSCNEELMEWEIPINIFELNEDDIECISCDLKYRDSADIDNFGV